MPPVCPFQGLRHRYCRRRINYEATSAVSQYVGRTIFKIVVSNLQLHWHSLECTLGTRPIILLIFTRNTGVLNKHNLLIPSWLSILNLWREFLLIPSKCDHRTPHNSLPALPIIRLQEATTTLDIRLTLPSPHGLPINLNTSLATCFPSSRYSTFGRLC